MITVAIIVVGLLSGCVGYPDILYSEGDTFSGSTATAHD
jgi:hypothetical protein